ncbi:hypothetical protein SCHAM137S_02083 [Streptomyces chartreusis]
MPATPTRRALVKLSAFLVKRTGSWPSSRAAVRAASRRRRAAAISTCASSSGARRSSVAGAARWCRKLLRRNPQWPGQRLADRGSRRVAAASASRTSEPSGSGTQPRRWRRTVLLGSRQIARRSRPRPAPSAASPGRAGHRVQLAAREQYLLSGARVLSSQAQDLAPMHPATAVQTADRGDACPPHHRLGPLLGQVVLGHRADRIPGLVRTSPARPSRPRREHEAPKTSCSGSSSATRRRRRR